MPESAKKCIASWRKNCPDYKIIEWNEANLDFVNAPDFVKEAYEAKAWGFVPDYFRLWIIYNYGGIYLDTDVQIIKCLDPLLSNQAFAGFEIESSVALGLGFGAEKYNPMIKEHMELYDTIHYLNIDGTVNRIPSPVITTEWLKSKGLNTITGKMQIIDGIRIYPKDFFAPKSFDTGEIRLTKNTYSIHQYDASWFTDEEKKALERARTKYKRDKIRYLPNRMLIAIIGNDRYKILKKRIKGMK